MVPVYKLFPNAMLPLTKVGPGSYSNKLNLIGQHRESDSKKGFGPLVSKAERLQDGIFRVRTSLDGKPSGNVDF